MIRKLSSGEHRLYLCKTDPKTGKRRARRERGHSRGIVEPAEAYSSRRSIVTLTDPGTFSASAPASAFAIRMLPGDGIICPS